MEESHSAHDQKIIISLSAARPVSPQPQVLQTAPKTGPIILPNIQIGPASVDPPAEVAVEPFFESDQHQIPLADQKIAPQELQDDIMEDQSSAPKLQEPKADVEMASQPLSIKIGIPLQLKKPEQNEAELSPHVSPIAQEKLQFPVEPVASPQDPSCALVSAEQPVLCQDAALTNAQPSFTISFPVQKSKLDKKVPAFIEEPMLVSQPPPIQIEVIQPLTYSQLTQELPQPLTQKPSQFAYQPQMQCSQAPIELPLAKDKLQKVNYNLSKVYKCTHKSLALKIDPTKLIFKAQLVLELALQEPILEELMSQWGSVSKVGFEIKLLSKQVQVIKVSELASDSNERIRQFEFNPTAQTPQEQAKIQATRFAQMPLTTHELDQQERQYLRSEVLSSGTVRCRKKIIQLKPQKQQPSDMSAKFKPKMRLCIDYFCDQITQTGGLRYVNYKSEESDNLERFFYTSDADTHCWLPELVGPESFQAESLMELKIVVPKDYTVIASGVQKTRQVDQTGDALHIFELCRPSLQTKVGFLALPEPRLKITQLMENAPGKPIDGAFACFLSQKKQNYLNPKLCTEIFDYIQGIVQDPLSEYPCQQLQVVFLPNLFPRKHPRQSMSFAGGLHLLDQNLIFRPNQIDKRHHLYKHLAGAMAYDFFGFRVREATPSDNWLLVAVRERIGDRFKRLKCGSLLCRYHVMRQIEKLYDLMRSGAETFPLMRQRGVNESSQAVDELQCLGPVANSADTFLSDIYFRKCGLLMHMIESNIDEAMLDKIFREMYQEAVAATEDRSTPGQLSQLQFRKKFKRVCGMQPLNYYKNWIWSTGAPRLELSYEFNKRNNSLDLRLTQESTSAMAGSERANLAQKLDHIFSQPRDKQEQQLQLENFGGDAPMLDQLCIDQSLAARRWFVGNINIVIYQVEGSGGDILKQQHKMTLREFKSTIASHIPLQGKVKRTMQNRKREYDPTSEVGEAAGASRLQLDALKFEMNEFELEDFPQETKGIFLGRELDNNPVLWIRVDPDLEWCRTVEVHQEKRNNWLFQLLRETDIIGQIEAVRRLPAYNEELVYEILKTVARSNNYFYKVRKEVLKALSQMEIFTFNKYISHEMFLMKLFNTGRLLESGEQHAQFYRENNFANILEYFFSRGIITAISKCKEQRLVFVPQKAKEIQEQRENRIKASQSNNEQQNDEARAQTQQQQQENDSMAITLTIVDRDTNKNKRRKLLRDRFDETTINCTTDVVAQMLMRLLEQNDNSEQFLDDSFYLRDLIAALGNLDNIQTMPAIAREVYRQFKLDQISNSSPQFSITLGAIKAYYNMKKQITEFKTQKLPYLDSTDSKSNANIDIKLTETLELLDLMKADIKRLFLSDAAPLQVRQFIFNQEQKFQFLHQESPFAASLESCLKTIYQLQNQGQFHFAGVCLQDLAMLLEMQPLVGKVNLIDAYLPGLKIRQMLWQLYTMPHCYLNSQFSYWAKRILHKLFGPQLNPQQTGFVNIDPIWSQTEADLVQLQNLQIQQEQLKIAQIIPSFGQTIQADFPVQPKLAEDQNQVSIPIQIKKQELVAEQKAQEVLDQNRKSTPETGGTFKIQIGALLAPADQKTTIALPIAQLPNQVDEDASMMSDNGPEAAMQEIDVPNALKNQTNGDEESEYDPFAAETFAHPVMQKCWLILGEIFYHYEATDFLEPITAEKFGPELYEEYCSIIESPMDIATVMERMRTDFYLKMTSGDGDLAKELFRRDIMTIFDNCREFNEAGTEIYNSANSLTLSFKRLWASYGLY